MTQSLDALAAFLPMTLVRDLGRDPSRPREGSTPARLAVMLFADLSGFTALTEAMDRSGPSGVERLTEIIDTCFSQLIETTLAHGGDVVRFAGDAVLAKWEAASDADRWRATRLAAQCAVAMQGAVEARGASGGARLRLKVGIGSGPVSLCDVGGEAGRWEFVATGAPLLEMAQAEHAASPGEIVVAEGAWQWLRGAARGERLSRAGWRLQGVDPLPLPGAKLVELSAQMQPALRAYLPEVVLRRLEAGHSRFLSEFRNVTVAFVNLGNEDFAAGARPDELQRAVRALQAAIFRYEGDAHQVVVDDKGVVAIAAFGLPPLSHEDDAARALRAAREIHDVLEAQSVLHRIGVASGRVFCGAYGTAVRRQYVMLGRVMNLAARLMQAAPIGEVRCDAATARQSAARVRCEALPPLALKGLAQPVEVFRPREVIADGRAPEPRAGQLVGREAERARLEEAVKALAEEGKGGVVLVEGEAGIGKSVLVSHVLERARASGVTACVGTANAVEQASAYLAWRPVLSQALGLDEEPDAAARTERALQRLSARPEQRDRAPLLNAVLAIQVPENDVVAQMNGALRGANTRELLLQLLQDAAEARPLVVVLDDVHWMDSSSWELAAAARRLVPRLLLVLSGRPLAERAPPEYAPLRQAPDALLLPLDRMPPDDVVALVCRELGVARLPPAVAALVRDKAEGHPLFGAELARMLHDAGHLVVEGGECRLTLPEKELQTLDLPTSVQGILNGRIDRLSPQEQLTLKVASVIGRVFPYKLLEEAHPVDADRPRLSDHLEHLSKVDLTQLESPAPELAHAFKHVLIQEVAYNLMAFAQRRHLHRAVADLLERDPRDDALPLRAHHWRMAEEPLRALECLDKAGEANLARGAYPEAATLLSQAQQLAATLPPEPPGSLKGAWRSAQLGEAYLRLGKLEASRTSLLDALQKLGRPLPATRLGWALRLVRELVRQVAHLALPGRRAAPGAGRSREALALLSRCHAYHSELGYYSLDVLAMIADSLASINDAEASGELAAAPHAYVVTGFTAAMMRLRQLSRRYFERARAGSAFHATTADIGEGSTYIGVMRWDEGRALAARGLERARSLNDRFNLATGTETLAVEREARDPASSLPLHEAQVKLARESSNAHHEMWGLLGQTAAFLALGRPDAALDRLHALEALLPQADAITRVGYHGLLALAAVRGGKPETAQTAANDGVAFIREHPLRSISELSGLTALGEGCLLLWEEAIRAGRADAKAQAARAAEACRALRSYARMFPMGSTRAERLEGVRAWLAGKRGRAVRLLKKALVIAQANAMPYDEALAHRELARAEATPEVRAEHLRQAHALFARLGCAFPSAGEEAPAAEGAPSVAA